MVDRSDRARKNRSLMHLVVPGKKELKKIDIYREGHVKGTQDPCWKCPKCNNLSDNINNGRIIINNNKILNK